MQSVTVVNEPHPPFRGLETYTSVPLQNIESGATAADALTGASYKESSEGYPPYATSNVDLPNPPAYQTATAYEAAPQNESRNGWSPRQFVSNLRGGAMAGETKCMLMCVGAGVALALLLIVILVPVSFSGMEYYEMGFKRRRTTGTVDTSTSYEQGLHLIGPDYEFKKFPADAHFESFEQLSIFNADRLEVRITAKLQYFLRPHQLQYLHKSFDLYYQPVLRKNAQDALKGAATVFTNREMILQRDMIEKTLFKAVKERLGGRCCEKDCSKTAKGKNKIFPAKCVEGCKPYATCQEADFGLFAEVRYFQLHELVTPPGLIERYLKALTLQDEDAREKLRQQAIIIRKDTEQLVQQKLNTAEETSQNATAMSSLLNSKALAESKATVEKARSEGLKFLYDELGITTKEQKNAFDYLRTLRKHSHAQLAVDYQTYVAGPMKSEL